MDVREWLTQEVNTKLLGTNVIDKFGYSQTALSSFIKDRQPPTYRDLAFETYRQSSIPEAL